MKKLIKIIVLFAIVAGITFYITRPTPEEREAAHIERGNEYFEEGELDKARIEYKNAAKLNPLNAEISYRWGLVEEAEGRIRSAYANFMRAEQQDPSYVPALLKIAHYNLVVEQYEVVNSKLSHALEVAPEDPQARALQGAVLLREGKLEEAEAEANFALSKDDKNITAYSVLTGTEIARGNLEKAEMHLNKGIAKNPKEVSLLLLKVKMYEDPLNIDKINEAYTAIFELEPKDVSLRTTLANIYIIAGRLDDAEQTMRNAVRDIPKSWALKQALIQFLSKNRSQDVAVKELQNMISQYPEEGQLYLWLAELYVEHDQIDKAAAILEDTVKREIDQKHQLNAHASLARITFRKGNRDIADKMVNAILSKSPDHIEARFIKASMLSDDGRYQEAVTMLRQIIRDRPQATEPRILLAEVLLLQKYPDLAIETLSQLLDIAPTNTTAKIRLAQLYSQYGSPQMGYDTLQALIKLEPNNPVAWENLARIAIMMRNSLTAKEAIKQLASFKGQEKVASFLSASLSQATGNDEDAFRRYTEIIEEDPNSTLAEHAAFRLLETYYDTPRFSESVNFLYGVKTQNAYIKNLLGESLIKSNKTEEAIIAFQESIERKPVTQDPYLNLASLFTVLKKFEPAEELLLNAYNLFPTDPRAGLMLGSLYSNTQQHDKALKLYEKMLDKNPELDVAANNAAAIITEHYGENRDLLKKAAQMSERFENSKNPAFLDTLGWVYFKLGEQDKAMTTIRRAISLSTNKEPDLYYHLGVIAYDAGQPEVAKEALNKALEANPLFSNNKQAKALLKKIK